MSAREVGGRSAGAPRLLALLSALALPSSLPAPALAQVLTAYAVEATLPSPPIAPPTATLFATPADDGTVDVALPFDVRLFDRSARALRVGANGALSIDPGASVSAFNDALGDADAPNRIVAAWWDDLELRRPNAVVGYRVDGAAPLRTVTVVWSEVERYGAIDGPLTFAITLYEGASGRVDVAYAPVADAARTAPAWSATVGVEGPSGAPSTTWRPCAPSCGADALASLSGTTFRLALEAPRTLTHAWRVVPATVARGERRVVTLDLRNGDDTPRTPSALTLALGGRVLAALGAGPTVPPRGRLTWAVTATIPSDLPLGPSAWRATLTVPDDPDPLDDDLTAATWVGPEGTNLALVDPRATLDGDTLEVEVTVASLGARPAPDAELWLVIGPDPVSSRADRRLAARAVSTLAGPTRLRLTAPLPADRGFADRFVGVVLDPQDEIVETDALDDAWTAPLLVPPPPRAGALRTTRLPRAIVGEPYAAALDVDAPDGAALALVGAPPPGLRFDAPTLSGVPTEAGVSPLVFTLSGAGAPVTSTLTLAVVRVDVPLGLAQRALPDATRGEAYTAPLFAVGDARGPLTWRVIGGAWPAGLAIVDAAVVGVPLEQGRFTATLEVDDGAARATGEVTLTIRPPLRAAIVARALPSATVGLAYTATIAVDPPSAGHRLTVIDGALPDGLVLEPSGALHGTPRAARAGGRARFVVALSDDAGDVLDRARLDLATVDPRPRTLTVDPPRALAPGAAVWLRAAVDTLEGGPFRITVRTTPTPLPAGLVLTVEEALGRVTLSGVAPRAGVEAAVWIQLVDDAGRVAEGVLAVVGAPPAPITDGGCHAHRGPIGPIGASPWALGLAAAWLARRRPRRSP